jgi:hypothetical protein
MLRAILENFARYRESHGMRSLSMGDVADIATGATAYQDVEQRELPPRVAG